MIPIGDGSVRAERTRVRNAHILALYNDGVSPERISKRMGIHRHTVMLALKSFGVEFKRPEGFLAREIESVP